MVSAKSPSLSLPTISIGLPKRSSRYSCSDSSLIGMFSVVSSFMRYSLQKIVDWRLSIEDWRSSLNRQSSIHSRQSYNKFCPLSVRSFNCYGAAMFPDNLMANIRRTITLGTHVRTEGALSSFVALFVQWPVASFIKHFMRMVKGSPGDFYSA